jgi:two-component sensor histidine kinase
MLFRPSTRPVETTGLFSVSQPGKMPSDWGCSDMVEMQGAAPSGIEVIPNILWGTHICQAFERLSDLEDSLVPYFAAGLKNNEACLWVTAPPFTSEQARGALRSEIPDLNRRESIKQIEIRDAAEWYKQGQEIRPDDFVSDLLQREREALERGYEGLRTNGNCSWVAAEQRVAFQKYEEMLHGAVKGRRMICMCSYGPQQTRGPAFHEVILSHDLLLSPSHALGKCDTQPGPISRAGSAIRGPTTFEDVLVTDRLDARRISGAGVRPALDQLVRRVTDHPSAMLPKLVKVALDICNAESAGVSVLEGDEFRWLGLCGKLSAFEGAKTPRGDSPCGVCLDQDAVVLMEEPERLYSWIADVNINVPEVLLVPLRGPAGEQVGTLWVVADDKGHFNRAHAQTLGELATFTGMALHMIKTEERLTRALEQERLMVGEMSHRVKNMYAVAAGIVQMSARNASNAHEMSENVIARLAALGRAHGLTESAKSGGVTLEDLLNGVLEPYGNREISGPTVSLGDRALAPLAMTFHELATNAVKYGALGASDGRVEISWKLESSSAVLTWRETNGPPPNSPAPHGFGSALIRSSIASLKGTITQSWPETGLEAHISLPLDVLLEQESIGLETHRG